MSIEGVKFKIDRSSPGYRRAKALADADHKFMTDLIKARIEQNLSQQQIADIMGVSQPTVAAFEKYDNDPKLSTIRRYAHAVGVRIDHLVTGDRDAAHLNVWAPMEGKPNVVVSAAPSTISVDSSHADFKLAA